MTRAGRIAYRIRWLILIAGLLCTAAGLWWLCLGPPFDGTGLAQVEHFWPILFFFAV